MVPFDDPTQFEDQAPEQHLTPAAKRSTAGGTR
jgi:hypothetical protein